MKKYKEPTIQKAAEEAEEGLIEEWKKEDIEKHNAEVDEWKSSFDWGWFAFWGFMALIALIYFVVKFGY